MEERRRSHPYRPFNLVVRDIIKLRRIYRQTPHQQLNSRLPLATCVHVNLPVIPPSLETSDSIKDEITTYGTGDHVAHAINTFSNSSENITFTTRFASGTAITMMNNDVSLGLDSAGNASNLFSLNLTTPKKPSPAHSPHSKTTQQLHQSPKSTPTDHNRFKFSKAIGSGAFGKVFEAADQLHGGQKVAIKIVSLSAQNSPQCDTLNEMKILKLLKHQHIVSYISSYLYQKQSAQYGSPVDEMAIVMEYCSHGSLMNKLMLLSHTSDAIPLRTRLNWYEQLSSAISYIHDKGVIHRDIKPENILLNDNDQVKVADVGLAKTAFNLSSFSQSGRKSFEEYMMVSVKGTPPYMAPEMYARLPYNKSCDVFSLGLVFWMIITLHPQCPEVVKGFGCKYLGELFNKPIKSLPYQKPTDLLSIKLGINVLQEKKLIDKMICRKPSDRIKMDEVFLLVKRLLLNYQPSASSPSLTCPQSSFVLPPS